MWIEVCRGTKIAFRAATFAKGKKEKLVQIKIPVTIVISKAEVAENLQNQVPKAHIFGGGVGVTEIPPS